MNSLLPARDSGGGEKRREDQHEGLGCQIDAAGLAPGKLEKSRPDPVVLIRSSRERQALRRSSATHHLAATRARRWGGRLGFAAIDEPRPRTARLPADEATTQANPSRAASAATAPRGPGRHQHARLTCRREPVGSSARPRRATTRSRSHRHDRAPELPEAKEEDERGADAARDGAEHRARRSPDERLPHRRRPRQSRLRRDAKAISSAAAPRLGRTAGDRQADRPAARMRASAGTKAIPSNKHRVGTYA